LLFNPCEEIITNTSKKNIKEKLPETLDVNAPVSKIVLEGKN
jgi:hypothetical protein